MRRASLLFACAVLFSTIGLGDQAKLGDNLFIAGVRTDEFDFFAAPEVTGKMRQSNWCWAACIQMVLNYHGLAVTQEQVVERVYGALVDAPAQPRQVLAALSGWAPDARGRFSAIHASPYVLKGSDIVRDLAFRWPLIVGLDMPGDIDHAFVLTAVTYSVDRFNEPEFQTVTLRDPMPGAQGRIEISWDEFRRRLMFICRVSVTRL